MKETPLVREIIEQESHGDVRLFRMQAGTYRGLHDDSVVSVGVPGMSDLIGFKSILITPEMVGKKIAIYTSIEVKSSARAPFRTGQRPWLHMVDAAGGISGAAWSTDMAHAILTDWTP
jgi:hypothetical protein